MAILGTNVFSRVPFGLTWFWCWRLKHVKGILWYGIWMIRMHQLWHPESPKRWLNGLLSQCQSWRMHEDESSQQPPSVSSQITEKPSVRSGRHPSASSFSWLSILEVASLCSFAFTYCTADVLEGDRVGPILMSPAAHLTGRVSNMGLGLACTAHWWECQLPLTLCARRARCCFLSTSSACLSPPFLPPCLLYISWPLLYWKTVVFILWTWSKNKQKQSLPFHCLKIFDFGTMARLQHAIRCLNANILGLFKKIVYWLLWVSCMCSQANAIGLVKIPFHLVHDLQTIWASELSTVSKPCKLPVLENFGMHFWRILETTFS